MFSEKYESDLYSNRFYVWYFEMAFYILMKILMQETCACIIVVYLLSEMRYGKWKDT